jgi:uncharacterized damage-inducible protein DinB
MPTLVELLRPEFDREMASTRRMLAAVPEEKFGWRPHAKSFTMGRLAGHVAEISSWTSDTLQQGRLDLVSGNQPENTIFAPTSHEQLLEKFDGWVQQARTDLAATNDAALEETWVMTWNGEEILRLPRRETIRTWVLNHTVHHRAQLGVYLRLNDVKVPGVYGPSADEK